MTEPVKTDLAPICALGAAVPQSRTIGAVTLTENAELGLASLALRRGGAAPGLGFTLPGPGGWAEGEGIAAFWTGPATVPQMQAHAESALARYKQPREYIRLDALPRTPTGKINRRALRERHRKDR